MCTSMSSLYKEITRCSGTLELTEPGDLVMTWQIKA